MLVSKEWIESEIAFFKVQLKNFCEKYPQNSKHASDSQGFDYKRHFENRISTLEELLVLREKYQNIINKN